MGIYDRDYSRSEPASERGIDWGRYLPPRGALALLVLHVLGFVMVRALQHDEGPQAAVMFALRGAWLHPAAIVLHPIGTDSLLTLVLVVGAVWTVGGRIESRFGTGRLLSLYSGGTIIAGVVYFSVAQMWSEFARYPLEIPAGGLAAWALAAWRGLADEVFSLFGRLITVAKATAIGTAVVAGLVFFRAGPDATAWLMAAGAGSLAWPLLNVVRRGVGTEAKVRRLRRAKPARLRPLQDDTPPAAEEPAIDDILAKISREGLDALTPAERERLDAAREAKLRQSP